VQPKVEEKTNRDLVPLGGVTSAAMREQSGINGASTAASTAQASVVDVESFIHEYYNAWGGTDLDRIMSYYAENVVLQIPGLLMEGKEAVRDQFAVPFTVAFPGNHHTVKNMVFGPGVVAVEFIFEAQHKGPFAGHAATGARIKLPGCGVYQYDLVKRQITAGHIYYDVGTLLQTITDSLQGDPKKAEEALQTNERNLSLITNVIPTFIHVLRGEGSVLYVNQAVLNYTGLTLEDVRKEDYRARVFHPEDVERLREQRRVALERPVPFENEQRVLRKDGKYRWFLFRYNPFLDVQGKIDRWYVAAFDIDDRKRTECLRATETRTLQMIADGASLADILNHVCTSIDVQISPRFTAILLMDPDGKKLWPIAGPKVPEDWVRAVTPLPVAADTGLCGTAAFLKARVIVPDVATESVWPEEYRGVALKNTIRAAWSQPILTKENEVLGTFAILSPDLGVPMSEDIALWEAAVRITLIAIERQRSQEALRNAIEKIQKSEFKLRQVIDTMPVLACCHLPDGSSEYINKGWHEYTGLSREEAQGLGWQAAFHPDDLPPLTEKWQKMLVSGESAEMEGRLRRHDGVYRWFLIRAQAFRDESGKIVRWYSTNTDIDDRKKVEEALRSSERNLAAIVNTIPTAAWTARPDGYCDFLNQVWLDYAGMIAEKAVGWGWAETIHPDDHKKLVETWKSSLASGTPVDTEARLRRFDSSYRWFLIRGTPLRDESGNILKWFGTCLDIEDRKRGEETLLSRELSWRQIVDNIPGLVATTGPLGQIEFLNRQTLEFFGKTSEELKDWALIDVVHPDDLPRVIKARKESIELSQIYEDEHRCRRADGVYRWLHARGLPVRDTENKITAWYLLLTDIDDRKKAEEALRLSERNLNQIINAIPTSVGVMRADGTPLYANQAASEYTGLTIEEFQTEGYRARIFHHEDLERLGETRRLAFTRPVPFENEIRMLGKEGKYRTFLFRYKPLLDEAGKIDRWYMAALDIEDRKQAEEALGRLAGVRVDVSAAFSKPAHLGEILRGCVEAIVRHLDAAFARIWMLNKAESVLELRASAGMYTRLDGTYSRIPVGDLEVGLIAREKKALFTNDVINEPWVKDKGWAQKNGMVAFAGYPLVVEDRLIGVVALFARRPLSNSILDTIASVADTIAQGIERKQTEEALRRSEFYLAEGQRLSHAGSWSFKCDLTCDYWSRELYEILGFDPANGIPTIPEYLTRVHPQDREIVEATIRQMVSAGEGCDLKKRIIRPDGVQRVIRCVGMPIQEQGIVTRFVGTLMDITEQEALDLELRRREAFLAEGQRLSHTGSWAWNASTGKLIWSEEHFRILGLDPRDTKPSMDVFWKKVHPDDRMSLQRAFESAIREKRDFEQEFRIVAANCCIRYLYGVGHAILSETGELTEFIGSTMDITERKNAEVALEEARAELERVTRVTTVGELAASIAHEINQPLAGVVTSANAGLNWLAAKPPNLSKTRESLERIRRDGTRGGEVLARIRALLKRTPPAKTSVSVNHIVRDVLALTTGEWRQNQIELCLDLTKIDLFVLGDAIQLQQVLLNLIKNAVESMAAVANGQRTLRIQSRLGELDGKPAAVIEISDTGVGFGFNESSRLFEAFHTTKPQGMGMGLWISRSIIESHYGRLTASPNDGPGATFHIKLPIDNQPLT